MLEVFAEGDGDPSEVWHRYVTPTLWPQWAPQLRGVEGVRGPISPGDRGRAVAALGLRLPFTVLAVDDTARRWSWRVGRGPFCVTMEHGVDAVDGRTRAWFCAHVPFVIGAPYAPLARVALSRLVRP